MTASVSQSKSLPTTLKPMLAHLARSPFDSTEHLFELKWEGIRALVFADHGRLQIFNRRGATITAVFPELKELTEALRHDGVILDGEIVCLDEAGQPNYQYLRERLDKPERRVSRRSTVHFIAFDLLYRDRKSLLREPLVARKNLLHELVIPSEVVQVSEFIEREGRAFFDATCKLGLEGIVAKEKLGMYLPGKRSRTWLKVKRVREAEFIIAGYTFGGKKNEPFNSLLLGLLDERHRLTYVGQVSEGIPAAVAKSLIEQMVKLHVAQAPFLDTPRIAKFFYWCRPELVCLVQYGEFTEEGQLAYPVFVALSEDTSPEECMVTDTIGWPRRLTEFA